MRSSSYTTAGYARSFFRIVTPTFKSTLGNDTLKILDGRSRLWTMQAPVPGSVIDDAADADTFSQPSKAEGRARRSFCRKGSSRRGVEMTDDSMCTSPRRHRIRKYGILHRVERAPTLAGASNRRPARTMVVLAAFRCICWTSNSAQHPASSIQLSY
ncbi:hypothetical protein GY45DRAFT_173299 [Cubamyces sp. BRFM 1775]|nr:hypothetical protein GY45DRAFT_173299 [Cubamyces sp. BRFM 1775]